MSEIKKKYLVSKEISNKLSNLKDNIANIPTKISDLTNDANFVTEDKVVEKITEIQDTSNFATKDDLDNIPTKISQLINDSGFIISIPEEYVTMEELNAKGYLTEHQDLSEYATTITLNNKVDKVTGKGLSTNDFTDTLKTKLEGLSNYDDTTLMSNISSCSIKLDEIKTLLNSSSGGGTTDLTEIETLVDECLALLN